MKNIGDVCAFCGLICLFISCATTTTPWWAWVIGAIILFIVGSFADDMK